MKGGWGSKKKGIERDTLYCRPERKKKQVRDATIIQTRTLCSHSEKEKKGWSQGGVQKGSGRTLSQMRTWGKSRPGQEFFIQGQSKTWRKLKRRGGLGEGSKHSSAIGEFMGGEKTKGNRH